MTVYPSPRFQAERTIAAARVLMAAGSLFAFWMDPGELSQYSISNVVGVNWAYLVYAAGLAVITWRRSGVPGSPLTAHVTDLLIFSGFQYLTPGSSSPFFIFFLFSMFCGALRWGWRGTLITAAFVMVAYLSAAVVRPAGPAEFDLNRFVTRIVYLVVSAGFLAYLGLYEERLRGELERLAHWPVVAASGTAQGTRQILEYAARILNAGRAVVIWEAAEEPISTLAVWSPDGFTISTHAPGDLTPLLPPVLERGTFLCATSLSETSTVLVNDGPGHLTTHTGIAIHPRLSAVVGGTGLASAPFSTARVSGRVFFADLDTHPEAIPLTELVAREIGGSLDQMAVTHQLQELAVREARLRLAQDLHDGVLQSLTGIRLELHSLAASVPIADAPLRDRLVALERALSIEQRDLRQFIDSLRPRAIDAEAPASLVDRLEALRERISLEWNTPVTIRVSAAAGGLYLHRVRSAADGARGSRQRVETREPVERRRHRGRRRFPAAHRRERRRPRVRVPRTV